MPARRLVLVLLLVVGAGLGASASTAGAAPSLAPVRVLDWNLCGANPSCASRGGDQNARAVVAAVERLDADGGAPLGGLALQEVCATQYRAMADALAPRGFSGAFAVTKQDATGRFACRASDDFGGHQAYGNAVFLRAPALATSHRYLPRTREEGLTAARADDLPTPPDSEQRKVVCASGDLAPEAAGGHLSLCSAHLVAGADRELRAAQVAALARARDETLRDPAFPGPLLIAGDLNAAFDEGTPDSRALEPFRASDLGLPQAQPTAGTSRIDFVFGPGYAGASLVVEEPEDAVADDGATAPVSDHRRLVATTGSYVGGVAPGPLVPPTTTTPAPIAPRTPAPVPGRASVRPGDRVVAVRDGRVRLRVTCRATGGCPARSLRLRLPALGPATAVRLPALGAGTARVVTTARLPARVRRALARAGRGGLAARLVPVGPGASTTLRLRRG